MDKDIKVLVNPEITTDQLFSFYQRNHICEEGYGKERACKPLYNSSLVVSAFEGDKLIGIARAMFDGLSAVIMEFCLELEYQGENLDIVNGSLIGKDESGLGKKIGDVLIDELFKMGADFISYDVVRNYEESFFESLGFGPKTSIVYYMDKRPYRNDERYITKRRSEQPHRQ
ncbi:MAG: hypothetical protein HYX80_10150 [Chloroflexi bacterium]|nr:hypothetical protein [Chloroflexota bacterium]